MKKTLTLGLTIFLISAGAWAGRADNRITISAVGDIMMGTNFPEDLLPARQGDFLFRRAASYLNHSDVAFGNLEGTLYDGEQNQDGKQGGANRYLFRTPTRFASRLKEAGFNVMGLANNHSHDFGLAGFLSTQNALSENGIQYSGKDGGVARFNAHGIKIAVIAIDFYPGRRSLSTPDRTYQEIRNLKQKYDLLVIYAHAGAEGEGADHVKPGAENFLGENRGNSIAFAHNAIDLGADVILMSGPHVPRALEVYHDHLIAYSLGNFVTERGISIQNKAGIAPLLRLQIDGNGKFLQGQLVSFQQTRNQGLVLDPRLEALTLMKALSESDFPDTHPTFLKNGRLLPSTDTAPGNLD